MRSKFLKSIKYILLLCVVIFIYKIFYPRTYDVPHLQKRKSTQYWNLTTGSTIGYTLIHAKGPKKPYPIIYLHGGPGSAISDRDIKVLSPLSEDGFDVYLYDQIGSGQSERLENIRHYSPELHKEDLQEIIKKLGTEKAILIGQSWGAILAVLYTAYNPGKVDKLIFVSPGPIFPRHIELERLKAPDSLHLKEPYFSNQQGNDKANNLRTKAMKMYAEKFGSKLASDKEADDFATYLNYEVNKSTVCDTSKILKAEAGGGFYSQVMTFKNLISVKDPRPKIKDSKVPLLIIKGQCDNQKWGYTTEYLELFPNHQLTIIPGAGHFISVEQSRLYIKTVREFINK